MSDHVDQTQQAAPPTPPHLSAQRRFSRWTSTLLIITALLVGLIVGTQLGVERFVREYATTGVAFLVGIAIACVLIVVMGFILYRVWSGDVAPGLKAVYDALRENPERAASADYWFREAPANLLPALQALGAKLGFASALTALTAIVANLILLATLVVSQLQADRLREQNTLLSTSNDVALLQARTSFELDVAQRKYDEINRILSESKSIDEQIYAVDQIPEAMVMPVRRVAVDEMGRPRQQDDGTLILETIHPNLASLRSRLISFIREDRVGQRLRDSGMNENHEDAPTDLSAAMDALRPLGPLSTSILRCLHRLGRGGAEPGTRPCVWSEAVAQSISMSDVSAIANLRPLLIAPPPDRSSMPHRFVVLDLRHIVDELRQSQLPYALFDQPHLTLRLAPEADVSNAKLMGAKFLDAHLDRVTLLDAQLWEANLNGAKLRRANLVRAQLQNAYLFNAKLELADMDHARLRGAWLENAELQGAKLRYAHLQGAKLRGAELQRADFSNASLQGATLDDAQFQQARFDSALLQGASLDDAELQSASLFGTRLQGARLIGAQLQGALLHFASLASADLRKSNFESGQIHFRTSSLCISTLETIEIFSRATEADPEAKPYSLPATSLVFCQLGAARFRLKQDDATRQRVRSRWCLSRDAHDRIRWSSLEEAVSALRIDFDDDAGSLVEEIADATDLIASRFGLPGERDQYGVSQSARLSGVFVFSDAHAFQETDADVPPRELFKDAISDGPNAITEHVDADLYRARIAWELGDPWPPTSSQPVSAPASQPTNSAAEAGSDEPF